MSRCRNRILWSGLTVCVVVTAACTGGSTPPTSTTRPTTARTANVDGVLTIASLFPQNGTLAAFGDPMAAGVALAVNQINAAGGVRNAPVLLVPADESKLAADDDAELDRLLDPEKVDAIVGPATSRVTKTRLARIAAAGVVECSPTNTADDLSTDADRGVYFRTAPPDRLQARALGDLVADGGALSPVVVAPTDAFGRSFSRALVDRLTERGATPTVVRFRPSLSQAAVTKVVADVTASGSDAVVLVTQRDTGGRLVAGLVEAGIFPKATRVYASDAIKDGEFYAEVDRDQPQSVSGISGVVASPVPDGVSSPFAQAFANANPGDDTIYAGYAWDCTNLIALASFAAGSDDPALIAEAMAAVSGGGQACASFAECRDLLAAGTDIDYQGASGPIDLDDNGDPTRGVFDVWRFADDGTDQVVDQRVV